MSSGDSVGVLDSSAGSIVWVRRRNGSWWPGRILGPQDLSSSHLMSPRSGTPVKLLGREDASVDWYNLEKSKRVKAFRCGEFDDCILRAEASQGLPSKKREKYARREDAILHALHLEKQFLNSKLVNNINNNNNKPPPPPPCAFHNGLPLSSSAAIAAAAAADPPPPSAPNAAASEDSNHTALAAAPSLADTSADSGSRNSLPIPIPIPIPIPSKRFLDPSADHSLPKRPRPLPPPPFATPHINSSVSSPFLSTNPSDLPFPLSRFPTHPLPFSPQHSHHSTSTSSEQTESDSSETHSIEPHVDPTALLSDAETSMRARPRLSKRLALQAGGESISNGDSDELSLDDRSQYRHLEQKSSGAEVSKWKSKGKRNVRSTGKRPTDRVTNKTYFEARGRPLDKMETSHSLNYYHDNGFADDDDDVCSDVDFDLHAHGFSQRGYLPSQAVTRRPFNGYWEERDDGFSPMFNGHDLLIDAELKVQANRQGEHVPWVSLMSKLNGKAIIGHPIQIENLEDGSTDMLLSTSNEPRFEIDNGKVPSMWRTARRTANVRVPHPHQSSQTQMYVDEDTEYRQPHHSGKLGSKKSVASNSARKGSKLKKTAPHVCRSPQGSNKAPRKGNLASNQKTKPLSSFGCDQKVTNKISGDGTVHYVEGAMKPVESGPPTVACIPVKLAFSRLLKAVGRPPSGSVANHSVCVGSNKDIRPFVGTL